MRSSAHVGFVVGEVAMGQVPVCIIPPLFHIHPEYHLGVGDGPVSGPFSQRLSHTIPYE